jgi:hypothetical protein
VVVALKSVYRWVVGNCIDTEGVMQEGLKYFTKRWSYFLSNKIDRSFVYYEDREVKVGFLIRYRAKSKKG